MNEQQAFNVLVQALTHANKAGAFELKDSATIFAALGVLAPKYENQNGQAQEGPHLVVEEAPTEKGKK